MATRGHADRGDQGWLTAGAVLATLAVLVVLGTIVLTPAYALPVGTGTTYGDSMGNDGAQAVVYTTLIDPSVGDEVVFDAGGRYGATHHRIIDRTPEGFVTKGDAVPRIDQNEAPGSMPYVTEENLHGVVIAAAPLALVKGALVAILAVLSAIAVAVHRRAFPVGRARA